MSNVLDVSQNAAAELPFPLAKRTRSEYSTVAKTGLIGPVSKNYYYFNFKLKNNQSATISKLRSTKKTQHRKRRWFSGIIAACHAADPGSIPGLRILLKLHKLDYDNNKRFINLLEPMPGDMKNLASQDGGTQIITISNTKNGNIRKVVEAVNNTFTKNAIIYDFSAFKNKKTSLSQTYGIKFLFKKDTDEFKISEFLDIEDEKIALTYRGRSKYLSNKSQNTTYGMNNTKNNNQNINGLAPNKKNSKKKLAQKSLNEFQNFKNFIESPTNDRTNDRTQDGTNSLRKKQYQYRGSNRGPAPKIIPKGLDLAGNKLTKEFNRVPYNEITLEATEINFGTDYSCPSSPPVVEIMDSNNGTVDDSKAQAVINYSLICKLAIETNLADPDLIEKLTFCTYNVRGIKGCQHEFNELIRARQPTAVAVQEILLNKKSYRYKLPEYTVIVSKSDQNIGGNELLIALKNNSGLQIFELKQNPY
ncbi:hypothetical protein BB561_002348 [Smittium simulii]|uniref:Endonuclease/exonuclease/phosphatase domain-containing protein n=1 Tax=Smittium simulii TaxID=133385 RepID=A0A2T9YQQ3_9FUNG|nr:hypothetical protein BB561_002348 [Smittium simulii]